MKDLSEQKIRKIFNEGFEQLVLPHFDSLYKSIDEIKKNMATKKELAIVKKDVKGIKEDIKYIHYDVDSIKRTLNAEVAWRDDASKRLKKIEVNIGLAK